MKPITELEHLENFVLSNPELDKLENLISDFNPFETLKLTFAEIRHSNVLSWLLDPQANHGLGSYFIRQFLKFIVSENRSHFSSSGISLFDFELFNYNNVDVRREWNNIDILIVINEKDTQIVVTIENKIKTTEHSNQLQRYRETVEKEFKDFTRIYIYLTPENITPSDEEWIPFNYDTIAALLNELLTYKKNTLNPNILTFILQYLTILRRYIVGNSEVEKIAIEIYKKHRQALDIIFQYKPDIYLEISEHLQKKLKAQKNIKSDSAGKTVIRFTTDDIDSKVDKIGEGWTKTKRVILFEFSLYDSRVALKLYIGPGDNNYREGLQKFFLQNSVFFKLANRKLGTKWHTVYQKNFLNKKDFEENEDGAPSELLKKIDKKFDDFVNTDLPAIHAHFEKYWSTK